jgi:hypothetical protein
LNESFLEGRVGARDDGVADGDHRAVAEDGDLFMLRR